MKTINKNNEVKEAEEDNGKKFFIFILTILLAIAIIKTVEFSYNYYKNRPKTIEFQLFQGQVQKIKTLDELSAYSSWILENKNMIEKENLGDYYKCLLNKAITQYNIERDEFLCSSFEARELIPPEIEKFIVNCN